MHPQRIPQIRWGDRLIVQVPAGAAPGTVLGSADLVNVPRLTGCGSPRIWLLSATANASEDPAVPFYQVVFRIFRGCGSVVSRYRAQTFFTQDVEPFEISQGFIPAVELRIQAEISLAFFSTTPSVDGTAEVTCVVAPYGPYSQTEVIP